MKRKLIVQGKGGYTVYLPKKWIDRKGLNAGDEINIVETDTALLISSAVREKKEISVEITKENRKDIGNILTHLYRRGFDTIKIIGLDAKLLGEIKQTTNNLLLGFEITERDSKKCKIENISEPTEQKYDVLLRRIFLIVKETENIIKRDFTNNKFQSMKEIEEFRTQQDKYILFCKRMLTKEVYERNPAIDWELLTFLMHIEHAYYYLYKFASENKIKIDKEIIKLLNNLHEYFELYYNAYYKKDMQYIHKINKLKMEFHFGKCLKLIEKSKGKNTVILSHIRELFRLIQIGTSPILSELLDKEIS